MNFICRALACLLAFLALVHLKADSQTCNNWLRLPSQPSYINIGDLDISGDLITVEALFSTSLDNGGFGDLVSKHETTTDVNYLLRAYAAEITTTNGWFRAAANCRVEPNRVYHAALVYDGNSLKFYRNGFKMAEVPATGDLVLNNWKTWIGYFEPQSLNENFTGFINEVRIWNIARTQTQIRSTMNSSLASPTAQTGLLAYYTFDNLINKQGNAAWNGTIGGSASINTTVTNCAFVIDSCEMPMTVVPDFDIPATVCVNDPVSITNNTVGASSYYWNFCVADINQTPVGTNIGNPGSLSQPVFMDYVQYNNNYYGFVINHNPGKLIRLNYGNSLLNTPTVDDLGNFAGVIPPGYGAEGIQVVQNEGRWYAIIVGGYTPSGSTPRILKVDFGPDLTNQFPVATNWGNIGNMLQPLDLHLFKEGSNWYGLTVNGENNTITRFSFTNSFNNTPTAVNLGGFGLLNYPTGIYSINDNGNWHVFVTNNGNSSRLVRLDFGSSLLNTPTAADLGSIGNANGMRDLTILRFCDQIAGFAVNATTNSLYRLNFATMTSVPQVTNLGNTGNLSTPHSISRLFRVNEDLYGFITNVDNNTITRLRFSGCTNSSIPNSTLQYPPSLTYNTAGIYNINLTIDDGLPTQTSLCKQVEVVDCTPPAPDSIIVNDYTEVLAFDICKNSIDVGDATAFNVGDTVLMMQMKGAMIDSTNTAAFGNISSYGNAGNYEYNYVKAKTGNKIELLNLISRPFDIPNGNVQLIRVPYYQNLNTTSVLTCLPWDGKKGGVLAVNVANQIQLNQDIDVSGRGFRGGAAITNSNYTCGITSYFTAVTNGSQAARKGEGIFGTQTLNSGRGKLANGGGGGNSTNSGGAGGGNGGVGGAGGREYGSCPGDIVNGGIGGLNLAYSNAANKVFMGAGGGAGHMNDVPALAPGGNGGGIVILNCTSINTNSFTIKSNGQTPAHLTGSNDDGKSGGGAGGTVLLKYNTAIGTVNGSVQGGDGDFCNWGPVQHGPGGGGGGGVVWISQATAGPNLNFSLAGGVNGVNQQLSNDPWAATPGMPGAVLTGLVLPVTTIPFKPNIDSVRIRKNAVTCTRFDFDGLGYTNNAPVSTWAWDFGDGATANTQNTTHTYNGSGNFTVKLVITDINGCKDSITTAVQPTGIEADFTFERDACDPFFVSYVTTASGYDHISWNFGDGETVDNVAAPTHVYSAPGQYEVIMILQFGPCVDSIKKLIVLDLQIDPQLVITPDTTICAGTTKQLRTASSLSFCWFPTTWLDNPASPNPITAAPENITYYFTAQVTGANLIANGDFTQGNTGFTSQYSHVTPNTNEGQYFVGTQPRSWNGGMSNCGDHTNGAGNMMMVNGSPNTNEVVWSQTVAVVPNTNYAFSTWITSLSSSNPAQLQFSINGKNVGAEIRASSNTCDWIQFYTTWNAGNSTSAVIAIVNTNTIRAGNDFALDDISFAPVFLRRDSVNIIVDKPLVRVNADTTVCVDKPVQLQASGAQSYSWTPATGLSNGSIANPVATVNTSTEFIVTGTNINGCVAKDTVNVNVFARPAITMTADTIICKNTRLQLSASGGSSYSWYPGATLNNTSISNPVAAPNGPIRYFVTITDNNNCEHLDSVQVNLHPDPVFAVNAPASICSKDSLRLNASGGDQYTWLPGTGMSNPSVSNPMVSPAGSTDYSVTILETTCNNSITLNTRVSVLPLPVVSASRSNDLDCSTDRSQLTASGGTQYTWTPSQSLSNGNIRNPVATPSVTTEYVVTGTDGNGCKNMDSVIVKVDNVNKGGYLMPNAFSPNNDGLNDCYGIRYWGVVYEVEFSIYNRWGELVFFTKDPGKCWDGRHRGKLQDAGVFVYMIKARTNCESAVFRKGTFVLVK